ncbi:hypothetical protein CXG81DRAFT_16839 [Caulochytrium protostelioides]|uniref:Histidine kinase n=1 Tax=Caulochytrium protostelioides TaxID=1555241 RepID=A0A4P9XDP4_9FUNG|nr:hypothetical protein CXG81DRAFT_16839 [Caulochytrium protostelioides]|eukprot:RKP03603.1 hypothetical protein CXG81DRAFT_16839 [Caulochytrium protostelioides]
MTTGSLLASPTPIPSDRSPADGRTTSHRSRSVSASASASVTASASGPASRSAAESWSPVPDSDSGTSETRSTAPTTITASAPAAGSAPGAARASPASSTQFITPSEDPNHATNGTFFASSTSLPQSWRIEILESVLEALQVDVQAWDAEGNLLYQTDNVPSTQSSSVLSVTSSPDVAYVARHGGAPSHLGGNAALRHHGLTGHVAANPTPARVMTTADRANHAASTGAAQSYPTVPTTSTAASPHLLAAAAAAAVPAAHTVPLTAAPPPCPYLSPLEVPMITSSQLLSSPASVPFTAYVAATAAGRLPPAAARSGPRAPPGRPHSPAASASPAGWSTLGAVATTGTTNTTTATTVTTHPPTATLTGFGGDGGDGDGDADAYPFPPTPALHHAKSGAARAPPTFSSAHSESLPDGDEFPFAPVPSAPAVVVTAAPATAAATTVAAAVEPVIARRRRGSVSTIDAEAEGEGDMDTDAEPASTSSVDRGGASYASYESGRTPPALPAAAAALACDPARHAGPLPRKHGAVAVAAASRHAARSMPRRHELERVLFVGSMRVKILVAKRWRSSGIAAQRQSPLYAPAPGSAPATPVGEGLPRSPGGIDSSRIMTAMHAQVGQSFDPAMHVLGNPIMRSMASHRRPAAPAAGTAAAAATMAAANSAYLNHAPSIASSITGSSILTRRRQLAANAGNTGQASGSGVSGRLESHRSPSVSASETGAAYVVHTPPPPSSALVYNPSHLSISLSGSGSGHEGSGSESGFVGTGSTGGSYERMAVPLPLAPESLGQPVGRGAVLPVAGLREPPIMSPGLRIPASGMLASHDECSEGTAAPTNPSFTPAAGGVAFAPSGALSSSGGSHRAVGSDGHGGNVHATPPFPAVPVDAVGRIRQTPTHSLIHGGGHAPFSQPFPSSLSSLLVSSYQFANVPVVVSETRHVTAHAAHAPSLDDTDPRRFHLSSVASPPPPPPVPSAPQASLSVPVSVPPPPMAPGYAHMEPSHSAATVEPSMAAAAAAPLFMTGLPPPLAPSVPMTLPSRMDTHLLPLPQSLEGSAPGSAAGLCITAAAETMRPPLMGGEAVSTRPPAPVPVPHRDAPAAAWSGAAGLPVPGSPVCCPSCAEPLPVPTMMAAAAAASGYPVAPLVPSTAALTQTSASQVRPPPSLPLPVPLLMPSPIPATASSLSPSSSVVSSKPMPVALASPVPAPAVPHLAAHEETPVRSTAGAPRTQPEPVVDMERMSDTSGHRSDSTSASTTAAIATAAAAAATMPPPPLSPTMAPGSNQHVLTQRLGLDKSLLLTCLVEAFDLMPHLLWFANARGSAEYFNTRWLAYTGQRHEAAVGFGWVDHVHPEDAPVVRRMIDQALTRQMPYEVEYRLRRYDGVYRWFLVMGVPMWDPTHTRILRWFGSNTDIHERHRQDLENRALATQLDERRILWESTLQQMPLSVLVANRYDREFFFLNDYSFWIWGAEELRSIETVCRYLKTRDGTPVSWESWAMSRSLYWGEVVSGEEYMIDRGHGQPVQYLRVSSAPIYDTCQRSVEVAVVVCEDVTAHVQREQECARLQMSEQSALTANKIKSEFFAQTAHEIRTPCAAVIGLCELLLDSALDTEQREYVEGIRRSGESLLFIINDILDFSKIEAGKLDLVYEAFNPRTILQQIVSLTTPLTRKRQLRIETRIAPDFPQSVYADPDRIQQIVTNFMSNAIKFSSPDSPIILSAETLGAPFLWTEAHSREEAERLQAVATQHAQEAARLTTVGTTTTTTTATATATATTLTMDTPRVSATPALMGVGGTVNVGIGTAATPLSAFDGATVATVSSSLVTPSGELHGMSYETVATALPAIASGSAPVPVPSAVSTAGSSSVPVPLHAAAGLHVGSLPLVAPDVPRTTLRVSTAATAAAAAAAAVAAAGSSGSYANSVSESQPSRRSRPTTPRSPAPLSLVPAHGMDSPATSLSALSPVSPPRRAPLPLASPEPHPVAPLAAAHPTHAHAAPSSASASSEAVDASGGAADRAPITATTTSTTTAAGGAVAAASSGSAATSPTRPSPFVPVVGKYYQRIRISVQDHGIGMSKETIERLFRPFSQADSNTTRKYGGTGLGLIISLRLAHLLHAQISVESELNVGSTFRLDLIVQPIHDDPPRAPLGAAAATATAPSTVSPASTVSVPGMGGRAHSATAATLAGPIDHAVPENLHAPAPTLFSSLLHAVEAANLNELPPQAVGSALIHAATTLPGAGGAPVLPSRLSPHHRIAAAAAASVAAPSAGDGDGDGDGASPARGTRDAAKAVDDEADNRTDADDAASVRSSLSNLSATATTCEPEPLLTSPYVSGADRVEPWPAAASVASAASVSVSESVSSVSAPRQATPGTAVGALAAAASVTSTDTTKHSQTMSNVSGASAVSRVLKDARIVNAQLPPEILSDLVHRDDAARHAAVGAPDAAASEPGSPAAEPVAPAPRPLGALPALPAASPHVTPTATPLSHTSFESLTASGTPAWSALPAPEPAAGGAAAAASTPTPACKGHILVAEDNRIAQLIAEKTLQKHGFRVTLASTGVEAVELVVGAASRPLRDADDAAAAAAATAAAEAAPLALPSPSVAPPPPSPFSVLSSPVPAPAPTPAPRADSGAATGLLRGPYDAILMDCVMPLMDGYEAAKLIRLHEKAHGMRRTPILAFTADALRIGSSKVEERGMDDYVTKPIKGKLLIDKLEYWIHAARHHGPATGTAAAADAPH